MTGAVVSPWITFELDDVAVVGGKAASLATLAGLGLATPRAFAITHRLFAALAEGHGPLIDEAHAMALQEALTPRRFPAPFREALHAALQDLGARRVAVRSSFAFEDDPSGLAPGVFASCVDIAPAEVEDALVTVLRSALSPGAAAYARARGKRWPQAPVAVLVHGFVAGHAAGHVAAEGARAELWVREGSLHEATTRTIEKAACAVAAIWGPYELEWVAAGDDAIFVQGRPYRAPVPPPRWQPQQPPDAPAFEVNESGWRWDEAHNPLPLSPAQQGLVALVEGTAVGYEQKVLGGYLFYREAPALAPEGIPPAHAPAALARLTEQVTADLAAQGPHPRVADALATFCKHYASLLGGIGHAAREGRRHLQEFVARTAPDCAADVPELLRAVASAATQRTAMAATLRALANEDARAAAWQRYVDVFGDEATAWDVAAPTFRERAAPRADASPWAGVSLGEDASQARFESARQRVRERVPPDEREAFDQLLFVARGCVAVGEDDDALYARLQAPVRHALLRLGWRLSEDGHLSEPNDIFFLSLARSRALDEGALPASAEELRREVEAARAWWLRQRQHPPPVTATAGRAGLLRGHGTGGQAQGRVHLHDPNRSPPADAVLVARVVLPTELPLLHVAAIVSERGGPLDHVAAQARERGLPAVVGVAGALATLAEGVWVHVDADAGIVRTLPSPSESFAQGKGLNTST